MPSPIAHAAAGYAIFRAFQHHLPAASSSQQQRIDKLLVIVIALSLLPDLDIVPGLLVGNLAQVHNSITNSLIVGFVISVAAGWVLARWWGGALSVWIGAVFAAYAIHVTMDYLSTERGVMALWPLTSRRFIAPLSLFYGVRYSEGLVSIHHLRTFLTELIFAAAVVLSANYLAKTKTASE